jgi:IclR family pca regulon transcriptional regulator
MLSLARGLAVIRAFDSGEPALSIAEVARITNLSRAAVRRCLHTLSVLGYARGRNSLYELTPAVLTLGHAYLGSLVLSRVAQPVLERVSATLHESSSLAVLDGEDVVYVARSATRRILSIALSVGSRLPAACTSMGRVLIAFSDEPTQKSFLSRVKLTRYTSHTITDKTLLRAELTRVRTQGFAIVDEELELGLRSLAVPVHRADGTVVAALNVGAHAARADPELLSTKFLPVLRSAATEIGGAMGPSIR